MRITREVMIGDRRVTVRELTVGEIRAWMDSVVSEAQTDLAGMLLFEELTLADLARLSDLPREDMDTLTPSELRQILAAAKEANADFFGMRARVAAMGARVAAISSGPSAAS